MRFPFSWLKEFIDVKRSPQKVAEGLTFAGLEVEELAELSREEKKDWVIDVAVPANRGDCLGLIGLAREIAAFSGGKVRLPRVSAHRKDASAKRLVEVKIRDPKLCRRYSARIMEGVRIAPSPPWLKMRLEAAGIRSVNNVVDVTNYVMLETGQPLHAFDLDRLSQKRIVVREAGPTKRFVTLDGVDRELVPEDLLICDGDEPVALAGVMGGLSSEVFSQTRKILLESAHFDPVAIRRTAKRLGLHSEASHRFERWVDPEGTVFALDRAVHLLEKVSEGVSVKGLVDCYPRMPGARPVPLRDFKIREILGIEIKRRESETILRHLGMEIRKRTRTGLSVLPPSFRNDVSREADLIEELARIHGYEKIPVRIPSVRPNAALDRRLRWERWLRSFLVGEGLLEVINLSFVSSEMNRRFAGLVDGNGAPVTLLNPLVQDASEMRRSLVPGLLGNIRSHAEQKEAGFCAFEIGRVYWLEGDDSIREKQNLSGVLYGRKERKGLKAEERVWSFLELKGLVEGMLEFIGIGDGAVWSAESLPAFLHPGKGAGVRIGSELAGWIGELHPNDSMALDVPPFLLFELDFETLLQYARLDFVTRPIPRFPPVERDLAVVVDEAFPAERVVRWIKSLRHPLIEDVQIFDEYRGPPIPEGKKNLAYSIAYRGEDRTLTDAEVNALHEDLTSRIGRVFGVELRG